MRWRFQQLELRWHQGDGFINNSSLLFHFLATWHAVSSARRYLYQKPIQLPITTKQQIKIFQSPPLQGVEAQSFCNTEMQKEAEEMPIEDDFWPTKNEWLMYLRLMVTSTLVHPMADLWLWLILFQKHVSSLDFMKLIHSRQGMKWDIWCGRCPTPRYRYRASKIQINAHTVTDWKEFCEGRVLPLTDITHFTLFSNACSLDFLYPRLYRDGPWRSLNLCMCCGGLLILVLFWIVQQTSTEHRLSVKH